MRLISWQQTTVHILIARLKSMLFADTIKGPVTSLKELFLHMSK